MNNKLTTDKIFKPEADLLFASEVKALSDTFRSKHRADIAQIASHVMLSTQLMLSFGKSNGIDMKVHLAIQNVLVSNWLVNAEIEPETFKAAIVDLDKASQTAAILSSLPD
jgi:Tfp pilus assembly protein PilV